MSDDQKLVLIGTVAMLAGFVLLLVAVAGQFGSWAALGVAAAGLIWDELRETVK